MQGRTRSAETLSGARAAKPGARNGHGTAAAEAGAEGCEEKTLAGVVPSPLPRHQFAVQAVFLLLHEHARTSGGVALAAPLDIVFDEYDVLQPDVLFFRAERRHLIRPDAVTRHAPDVAVEVLSPSTAAADRGRKMRTFARYGVPRMPDRRPGARRPRRVTRWGVPATAASTTALNRFFASCKDQSAMTSAPVG